MLHKEKCKMKYAQHKENMKSEGNSETLKSAWRKCSMRKVQHEEHKNNATCK